MTPPLVRADLAVPPAQQTDEDVIRQVLAGNTAQFELLMRRHNERIYRAARAILRDEHEVEDVMQQAYVNAFAHLRQYNGSARFSTWLTRIAINESLARVRHQSRHQPLRDTDGGRAAIDPVAGRMAVDDPERDAIASELRMHLESAIDTLPDGIREVVVLRAVQGLSTAEVAVCLNVSEDLVKTRLLRGRAALRRILLERAGAPLSDAFRFYRPRCDRVVARVFARLAQH